MCAPNKNPPFAKVVSTENEQRERSHTHEGRLGRGGTTSPSTRRECGFADGERAEWRDASGGSREPIADRFLERACRCTNQRSARW